jgi:hypothetical protein
MVPYGIAIVGNHLQSGMKNGFARRLDPKGVLGFSAWQESN